MTEHAAYVLGLQETDQAQLAVVGGKGAHLGALSRLEGVRVPPGFCVTTAAFERVMRAAPSLDELLDRLSLLKPDERESIRTLSAEVREAIEGVSIPDDVAEAITGAHAQLGEGACAVRSSATAEDSPAASFAGQHDSYLNVVGQKAVLEHVSRCWASLFTERAVSYRLRNGFEHRTVHMAVVVQRMVAAQAAGVLFTADPVTGNRKVSSVEGTFGLGEAFVSGLRNADVYTVRDDELVAKQLAEQPERPGQPALTDAQVIRLARLGRQIEAHFGRPQDIEWCLAEDDFHIVQSRPITTLFPVPAVDDQENHVYLSVGHQQMMTDPMKPLGISFWQMTAGRPMLVAGGRLFVDITQQLASPAMRAGLLAMAAKSDPLVKAALESIIERGDFIRSLPDESHGGEPTAAAPDPIEADPTLAVGLMTRNQASIEELKREIRTKSGLALLDFIQADIPELRRLLFDPESRVLYMTAMEASWWLNEKMELWLGEKCAADTLTLSVENNITSEMGLALLDVADAIRPHADVVTFLQSVDHDSFLDELASLPGGRQARDAINGWLDRYGMRGAGEIDITRPRFRERPATLLPVLLGNIKNVEPGESARRFEHGRQEALQKAQELLERLRALPDGEQKAEETKRMIDRVRTFIGYREYPKYGMISRYFVYKQALLQEAERLVQSRVLRDKEDVYFLTFEELRDVIRSSEVDNEVIRQRREAFKSYHALTPPRVLTSEGEAINGAYRRDDFPAGALVGLAVSAGTIEGRARVILDMAAADLEPGDILVTTFTDPSWTPLFVAIKGLVTEVGGLMTHGAVIAREYGLPCVVGVQNATRLIQDGQRIRVHGTDGYVEILP